MAQFDLLLPMLFGSITYLRTENNAFLSIINENVFLALFCRTIFTRFRHWIDIFVNQKLQRHFL